MPLPQWKKFVLTNELSAGQVSEPWVKRRSKNELVRTNIRKSCFKDFDRHILFHMIFVFNEKLLQQAHGRYILGNIKWENQGFKILNVNWKTASSVICIWWMKTFGCCLRLFVMSHCQNDTWAWTERSSFPCTASVLGVQGTTVKSAITDHSMIGLSQPQPGSTHSATLLGSHHSHNYKQPKTHICT